MNIKDFFNIDDRILEIATAAENDACDDFKLIEETAAYNGAKVLAAFQKIV